MKNDNRRQVKVRRKYSLSPSLIKRSFAGQLMPRCTCWRLSHMLRLYVCNVIKAGMSKWAKLVQILVNDKGFKMPFLRGTHLPVAHRICQVVSNIRKPCLVEIEQTARKLETNAYANFSQGREHGISMYGRWSLEHAHTETFVAHCSLQAQCWNRVRDLDRSPENMLITSLVLFVTRTLRKGTINVGN